MVKLPPVDELRRLLGPGIVLVDDAELFGDLDGGKLSVVGDLDEGDELDFAEVFGDPVAAEVPAVEVFEGEVVVGGVGGDGHDDPAPVVRIDEGGGEDQDLGPCEGIFNFFADEVAPPHLADPLHRPIGEGQLLERLLADDPGLVADPRHGVDDLGVDPEVRHPEDRLGAQGGAGEDLAIEPELDQGEVYDRRLLPLEDVVVLDGVLVVGTPPDGVAPLGDVAEAPEDEVLPFDELLVGGVGGGELPPPVDGVADRLHRRLRLPPEVVDDRLGGGEGCEDLQRYVVVLGVDLLYLRVAVLYKLAEADDGSSGDVKAHGEEDVLPPHPSIPSYDVADGEGPGVAGVEVSVQIGVGYRYEELLLIRWLRREDPRLGPLLLPLRFNRCSPVIFEQIHLLQAQRLFSSATILSILATASAILSVGWVTENRT